MINVNKFPLMVLFIIIYGFILSLNVMGFVLSEGEFVDAPDADATADVSPDFYTDPPIALDTITENIDSIQFHTIKNLSSILLNDPDIYQKLLRENPDLILQVLEYYSSITEEQVGVAAPTGPQ